MEKVGALYPAVYVTKRRKILGGKADAVEQRDLSGIDAARGFAADHAAEFRHRIAVRHLLDFAFDPRLGLEFDESGCARENVPVQFGLARTIAADRVDVNARADHIVDRKSTRLNASH